MRGLRASQPRKPWSGGGSYWGVALTNSWRSSFVDLVPFCSFQLHLDWQTCSLSLVWFRPGRPFSSSGALVPLQWHLINLDWRKDVAGKHLARRLAWNCQINVSLPCRMALPSILCRWFPAILSTQQPKGLSLSPWPLCGNFWSWKQPIRVLPLWRASKSSSWLSGDLRRQSFSRPFWCWKIPAPWLLSLEPWPWWICVTTPLASSSRMKKAVRSQFLICNQFMSSSRFGRQRPQMISGELSLIPLLSLDTRPRSLRKKTLKVRQHSSPRCPEKDMSSGGPSYQPTFVIKCMRILASKGLQWSLSGRPIHHMKMAWNWLGSLKQGNLFTKSGTRDTRRLDG